MGASRGGTSGRRRVLRGLTAAAVTVNSNGPSSAQRDDYSWLLFGGTRGGCLRRSKRTIIHRLNRIGVWVSTFLRFNLQFHIAVVFPTSENTQTNVFTLTTRCLCIITDITNIAIAITNIANIIIATNRCLCIITNIFIAITRRCLCITTNITNITITSRCLTITTIYFSITSITNINIFNNLRVLLFMQPNPLFNFTQKPNTRSATGGALTRGRRGRGGIKNSRLNSSPLQGVNVRTRRSKR